MSHIDEGALHAYLDGALDAYPAGEAAQVRAHLDSCDACARRLEEERAIREEAESILAPSAPVVQMPPLEDLRLMAKRRTETSRARGMSRVNRWGWAASVVLALGTGWMLRGSIPGTVSRPMPLEQAFEPNVPMPAADEAVGTLNESEQGRQQNESGATEALDPATGSGSEGVETEATVGFADADALQERVEEQPDVGTGGRDAAAGAVGGLSVPPPAAPAPTLAQERAVIDSLASMGEADKRTLSDRAERPRVARSAAAPAEIVDVPSPATEERSARAFRRLDDAAAAKSILSFDEAEGLVVPGLEIIEIAAVEDAQVDGVVLVRQLMENRDTLEIFHLPAGSDLSALPSAPTDGRTQLVAANGEGWIVLHANAERGELERYLERIRGG